MDYRQEAVATLHDFGDAAPVGPLSETAVVVPLMVRDIGGLAPGRVFDSLSTLEVGRVIVPLRAPEDRVPDVRAWLAEFDIPVDLLWCNAPEIGTLLGEHKLDGPEGKGRDVWLALGLARGEEFVALHDADVRSHRASDIHKLVAPLEADFDFVKAYYARVENDQLFGRLYRLFVAPLIADLAETETAPILRYLRAFRYPLAGEMAMTGELAGQVRIPRRWGIEIGILGETFETAGFEGSAQVDLGRYEHEHRSVSGPRGLSDMSHDVARALFRVLSESEVTVEFEALRERYRERATAFVDRYAADAWFNDLSFDREAEHRQVDEYAEAITEPEGEERLPPWKDISVSRAELESVRREALEGQRA